MCILHIPSVCTLKQRIHSLCLRAYLPEEVAKLNDIAEMRAGTKLEKPLRSEYIPLPDLSEQPENVQRPGSEVVEKGMLT